MNDITEEFKALRIRVKYETRDLIDLVFFRRAVFLLKIKERYKLALIFLIDGDLDTYRISPFANFSSATKLYQSHDISNFISCANIKLEEIVSVSKRLQTSDLRVKKSIEVTSNVFNFRGGK
ncbi:MAG: hypothetical protein V4629_03240 [Pseudomonadota bacterium]